MELRKTILFIGNNEDDRTLFESAVNQADCDCNFLALDNEPYTITRLKKSQPFWYQSIFIDLATPSLWSIALLREIANIEHLRHVPVVIYTDDNSRSDLDTIRETGITRFIFKPTSIEHLVDVFNETEVEATHNSVEALSRAS